MPKSRPVVGGLTLPIELVEAIRDGRWRPPRDQQIYETVFGDGPELPVFFDLTEIYRENLSWQAMSGQEWYGDAVEGQTAGVEPARSVLIGSLGPDMPIVLMSGRVVGRPGFPVIKKPFSQPQLANIVGLIIRP